MLVTKDNPVGIDKPIQGFQTFLYGQLMDKWGLSEDNFQALGRCYRDRNEKGYVPKLFVSSASDYQDILFDDQKTKALFFFDEWDTVRFSAGSSTVRVDLIFIVNLKIKDTAHRGDEEVRNEVERLCHPARYGFKMVEMVTGYRNVFGRFDGLQSNDQTSLRDYHPLHVFKIGFDVTYNIQS